MKAYIQLLLFLLILSIPASAQNKGGERKFDNKLRYVQVSDGIELFLSEGDSQTLRIETSEEVLPHVLTEFGGNDLFISVDDSDKFKKKMIKVYLEVKDLLTIEARAKASVMAVGKLNADSLNLYASFGANIKLSDLSVRTLFISTTTKGVVELKGATVDLNIEADEWSVIKAKDFRAENVSLALYNATATVRANKLLEGDVLYSDITYYGSPQMDLIDEKSSVNKKE